MMNIPDKWRVYECTDYFESALAMHGYWDERSQIWVIEPIERVEERTDCKFLQIGRPGVDGIGFGYRLGQSGIWA